MSVGAGPKIAGARAVTATVTFHRPLPKCQITLLKFCPYDEVRPSTRSGRDPGRIQGMGGDTYAPASGTPPAKRNSHARERSSKNPHEERHPTHN